MIGAYGGILAAENAIISLLLSCIAAMSDHKPVTGICSPAVWPLDNTIPVLSVAAVLAIPENVSDEPNEELAIISVESKAFFKLPDDLLAVGNADNSDTRSTLSDTVISLKSLMES